MKHILKLLASLDLRERIWGRYKRIRQAAWCVRKGMAEEKELFSRKGEIVRDLSCGVGSTSPIMLDATIRRAEKASVKIAKTSPVYDWLTDKADRLRFWYFLLHGRVISA